MDCRSCGVDLPRDAVYCLRCGARVELGSVLGVGTDLPPVPPRDQGPAARQSVPTPTPTPEQDLSQTAVLPRLPATPPLVPPAPSPRRTLPDQPFEAGADQSGHSRGTILAMVATFVVLTIIGTFALTRIVGPDAPETSATLATPSEEGQDSPSTSPASPGASPSAPSASSPAATPSASGVVIPEGARRCSTSGGDAVATAYAATERTSCEFAAAVREAYRAAGTPEDPTALRAFSPVTKKWYSLSCDGGAPVRCTSTTNAVVLLAP